MRTLMVRGRRWEDADHFDTPQLGPAPELRLLRDAVHSSAVDLPMVSGRP